MPLHAFVDESYRTGVYIVCAIVVDSSKVAGVRQAMKRQLKGSQGRVHMAKENAANKRALLDQVLSLSLVARVVTVSVAGKSQRSARDACLSALASELKEIRVARMVIESCDQDRADRQVIGDTLARSGSALAIDIQHLRPREDPLLWVADIVAWAYGRSGSWGVRVAELIEREIRL